jgi:hypothetical protein
MVNISDNNFSDPNFDPISWINSQNEPLDVVLSNLDQLSEELANNLENICLQAYQAVPKVLEQMDFLKREAKDIKSQIETFELNSSDSCVYLATLHEEKAKLENSISIIRQSEKWNTIQSEFESILAVPDYVMAANRLLEAKKNINIGPNIEKRQSILSSLTAQLVTVCSPLLVSAFASNDIDAIKIYCSIYTKIDKIDILVKEYLEFYQSFVSKICGEMEIKLNPLQHFYDEFYILINKIYVWNGQLFQTPADINFKLIDGLFLSVKSFLKDRLEYLVSLHGDAALPKIVDDYVLTKSFLLQVEKLIPKCGRVLLDSFLKYQRNHSEYEKNYLLSLCKQELSIDLGFQEYSRTVCRLLPQIIEGCKMCIKRTYNFTNGLDIDPTIKSLNEMFNVILSIFTKWIGELSNLKRTGKKSATQGQEDPLDFITSLSGEWEYFELIHRTLTFGFQFHRDVLDIFSHVRSGGDKSAQVGPHAAYELLNGLFKESDRRVGISQFDLNNLLQFLQKTHFLLFATLWEPIKSNLHNVRNVYTLQLTNKVPAFQGLEVPEFSLSPSSNVHKVGEHLLTITQQMEMHVVQNLNSGRSQDLESLGRMKGWIKSMEKYILEDVEPRFEFPSVEKHDEDDPIYLWVELLSKATLNYYVRVEILSITPNSLGIQNAKQLLTDMEYFYNVLSAMGITDFLEYNSFQILKSVLESVIAKEPINWDSPKMEQYLKDERAKSAFSIFQTIIREI